MKTRNPIKVLRFVTFFNIAFKIIVAPMRATTKGVRMNNKNSIMYPKYFIVAIIQMMNLEYNFILVVIVTAILVLES